MEYSKKEQQLLVTLGFLGFFVFNAVFLYGLLFDRQMVWEALYNPVALIFILEAITLMFFFAYLFKKWGVSNISPLWFVILSLLGSMAFALPIALLWRKKGSLPQEELKSHEILS